MTNIVEQLCEKEVSITFVTSLTKKQDLIDKEWSIRSLVESYYPNLFVDPMYINTRENGKVIY